VRRGGAGAPGYGHLKARVIDAVEERFREARAKREELLTILPSSTGSLRAARSARGNEPLVPAIAPLAACGLR
jgi:hypothetical protein